MNNFIALLSLLVITSHAVHLNMQKEAVEVQTINDNHHDANGLKQKTDKQTIANEQNKPLTDFQYSTQVRIGAVDLKQVIDTTSFVTWVFSKNPTTGADCINCPQGRVEFVCKTPSCKLSKKAIEYTGFSHGARVSQKFKIAKETTTSYSNQVIRDLNIGLAYQVVSGIDQLVPTSGNLGLAYGSEYKKYATEHDAQVKSTTAVPNLQQSDKSNFVSQYAKQLPHLAPKALFAMKLEENLAVLSVGEANNYFAADPYTNYQNSGKSSWALSLTSFQIGDEKYCTTHFIFIKVLTEAGTKQFQTIDSALNGPPTRTNRAAHSHPVLQDLTKVALAVFDSTTKFFQVSEEALKEMLIDFNGSGKKCALVANKMIKCSNVKQSSFLPLKLKFNNKKKSFVIASDVYTSQVGDDVYVNIVSFGDNYDTTDLAVQGQPLMILGQLFLQTHYVVFDQDKNEINIAKSYTVAPSPLTISSKHRIIYVVAGLLLLLFALVTLLSILKLIDPKNLPEIVQQVQQAPQVVLPRLVYSPQSMSQVQPQFFYPQTQSVYGQPIGSPVLTGSRLAQGPPMYRR